MNRFTAALTLSIVLGFAGTSAFAGSSKDICDNASLTPDQFAVILEEAVRDERGNFVGIFRLENHSPRRLSVMGRREKGKFWVGRPETELEYLDVASQWTRVIPLPASFSPRSDELVVHPKTTGKFSALLMSQELADRNARSFRLLVRTSIPVACLVSSPFEGLPRRAPVQGFVTSGE